MATKTTIANAGRLPCGGTPYEDVSQLLSARRPHNNYGKPGANQRLLIGYWELLSDALADLFAANNPDFDRAAFLSACGLEGEE